MDAPATITLACEERSKKTEKRCCYFYVAQFGYAFNTIYFLFCNY